MQASTFSASPVIRDVSEFITERFPMFSRYIERDAGLY